MTYFNFTDDLREHYTDVLTKNPLIWAGDSIDLITSIVEAGSHEPYGELDDPDYVVEKNRDYLENAIHMFEDLDLPVPVEIQPSIDRANEFLKERT